MAEKALSLLHTQFDGHKIFLENSDKFLSKRMKEDIHQSKI